MNAAQLEHMHIVSEKELDRLQALMLQLPVTQQLGARMFSFVVMKAFALVLAGPTTSLTLRTMLHFLEHHLAVLDDAAEEVARLA